MKKGLLEPITYFLQTMPVSAQWALNVNFSRNSVGSICEVLHGLAHERSGGAIYYPDIVNKKTICRYEWPLKWRSTFPRIHLVMSLVTGTTDINNIDCYLVDTAENGEVPFSGVSLNELIEYGQNISIEAIEESISHLSKTTTIETNVVFYLDIGQFDPVFKTLATHDAKFKLFQSYLSKDHKRISAVIVNATEKNQEMAKAEALRDMAIFSALMTLGCGSLIKTTTIDWNKKTAPLQFIEKDKQYQTRVFYPKSAKLFIKNNNSARLTAAALFPWEAYEELSDVDKSLFLNSLFAYQSAKELMHTHSTLAVIAYIASLSAISKFAKQRCQGSINCSECGDLAFQHDLVGDQRAVINTIAELLGLEDPSEEHKSLKKVIGRVYREQRSAYVHAAVMRHNEYFQQLSKPTALPTNTKHVSDVFIYGRDLDSLESLARQSLLRWLAVQSGVHLPEKELGIDEIKIERNTGLQTSFSAPPKRIVSLRFT